jgi:hypothetical protein
MTTRMLLAACVLAATLNGTEALAQTEGATGTVQSVRTYGDGRVLVTGFTFSTTTCNNGSFWIPGDHPKLDRLLATILTAQTTGATITVLAKTDCSWFPEITTDSTTYVLLNSN